MRAQKFCFVVNVFQNASFQAQILHFERKSIDKNTEKM